MKKELFFEYVKFTKTKVFWKHAGISFFLALFLFYIVIKSMALSTHKGERIQIPNLLNQKIANVPNLLSNLNVNYLIIDSVYNPNETPGVVIKQEPVAGEYVKANRNVYLYITTLIPPQIRMPKLVDRSLRQAVLMIESYGLKLGKVKYVSDACKNCVLNQRYNGREISPNDTLRKGAFIDLWVGKGDNNTSVSVPSITGLSYCEAKKILNSLSLNFGTIHFNGSIKDTCNAIVTQQFPEAGSDDLISSGSLIEIHISNNSDSNEK